MQALRIISDEHQALAAILHAIHFMLKEIAAGRLEPDLKLFQAMVHYLDAYPEKRHHPKEDLIFSFLPKRTAEGQEALAELDRQHAAAPARIAALETALAAFVADPAQVAEFIRAYDVYADFYRNHMLLEEDVLLPLARQHLTAEDWALIDRRLAEAANDSLTPSASDEDFAALFSKLVACAPAPIGLGAAPYQD